jgi:hypothetical protein
MLGLTIFFADTGSTDQLKQLLQLVHKGPCGSSSDSLLNYVHHKELLYYNLDRI